MPLQSSNLTQDWDRPILIGSAPSSGSTLLSVILDAHPDVVCGPELSLFSHPFFWSDKGRHWQKRLLRYTDPNVNEMSYPDYNLKNGVCPYVGLISVGKNLAWYGTDIDGLRIFIKNSSCASEFARHFFSPVMQANKKKIWVEKSPTNIYSLPAFLETFPGGRGVLIIRDGRDVVCSLMQRGFDFGNAVAIWILEAAMCIGLNNHNRVKLLRYEDMIHDPHGVLEDLTTFLGIAPAIEKMLAYQKYSSRVHSDPTIQMNSWKNRPDQPLSSSSIGRWQKELSQEQVILFYSHRLKGDFPGLGSLDEFSGEDIIQAFGYPTSTASTVTWDALSQYLQNENSVLDSVTKPLSFHTQYVKLDLDAKMPPLSPNTFVKFLAKLVQGQKTYQIELENLRKNFHSLNNNCEATKRISIVKMILRKFKKVM